MKNNYPCTGEKLENIYTLAEGIGKGGNDTVYKAEVDLEHFDYAMVAAYRDSVPSEDTLPERLSSDGKHSAHISKRLEALRKDDMQKSIKKSVQRKPELYPYRSICAVKILDIPGDVSDEERKKQETRFEREWKNMMSITHRNVITVYGGGRTVINGKETCYYSMEYLDDVLMKEEIVSSSLSKKLTIAKKAAEGLKAVHSRDLVHRDIKPSNILITQDGDVKITDAGIVKDMFKESELSAGHVFIGTPGFESPEQAESTGMVDRRTDIYSLGASFYYWLTGVEPYEDNRNVSNMMDVIYVLRRLYSYASGIKQDVYALSSLPDDVVLPTPVTIFQSVPDPVVNVLRKMMNPDRDRFRYQSIDRVIADLNAVIEGKPLSAASAQPPLRRKRGVKTKRGAKRASCEKRKRHGVKRSRSSGEVKKRTGGHKRIERDERPERDSAAAYNSRKQVYVIGGIVAALAVLCVVLICAMSDEDAAQKKKPEQTAAEKQKHKEQKEKERRLQELKQLHEKVLAIVERNPESLELHEPSWNRLLEEGKGTEYEKIARRSLDEIAAVRKKAEEQRRNEAETALKKLTGSVNGLLQNSSFQEALKACDEFDKERASMFPFVEKGISLLRRAIRDQAEKEADTAVSRARELCAQEKFGEARDIVQGILDFGIKGLQKLHDKEMAQIGRAELESIERKKEEVGKGLEKLLAAVRSHMARREFGKGIACIHKGSETVTPEAAAERFKAELAILKWAEAFMEQCRKRAAIKPENVELTVEKITGTIIRYDPDTDEIEIELRTEHVQTTRTTLLRNLTVDDLLRLSAWDTPKRHKPREALAAACFLVLTRGRKQAEPYFEKITESGLADSDLQAAVEKYGDGVR